MPLKPSADRRAGRQSRLVVGPRIKPVGNEELPRAAEEIGQRDDPKRSCRTGTSCPPGQPTAGPAAAAPPRRCAASAPFPLEQLAGGRQATLPACSGSCAAPLAPPSLSPRPGGCRSAWFTRAARTPARAGRDSSSGSAPRRRSSMTVNMGVPAGADAEHRRAVEAAVREHQHDVLAALAQLERDLGLADLHRPHADQQVGLLDANDCPGGAVAARHPPVTSARPPPEVSSGPCPRSGSPCRRGRRSMSPVASQAPRFPESARKPRYRSMGACRYALEAHRA